jgi:hypothetical protein
MYTIGTPLPSGSSVKEQLDKWITLEQINKNGKVYPVGHMELVPIPEVLNYAFIEQGLTTDKHMNILSGMKNHLTNYYCDSLRARGQLDDCDTAKALSKIHVQVIREAGYPFDSGKKWGIDALCSTNDGIVTE